MACGSCCVDGDSLRLGSEANLSIMKWPCCCRNLNLVTLCGSRLLYWTRHIFCHTINFHGRSRSDWKEDRVAINLMLNNNVKSVLMSDCTQDEYCYL